MDEKGNRSQIGKDYDLLHQYIMTAVSDSLIFRHIFSTAESAAIWSDSGEK